MEHRNRSDIYQFKFYESQVDDKFLNSFPYQPQDEQPSPECVALNNAAMKRMFVLARNKLTAVQLATITGVMSGMTQWDIAAQRGTNQSSITKALVGTKHGGGVGNRLKKIVLSDLIYRNLCRKMELLDETPAMLRLTRTFLDKDQYLLWLEMPKSKLFILSQNKVPKLKTHIEYDREEQKKRYQRRKDKKSAYNKLYYKNNKEWHNFICREYKKKNKVAIAAKRKADRLNPKPKRKGGTGRPKTYTKQQIKIRRKKQYMKYYNENKDAINKAKKEQRRIKAKKKQHPKHKALKAARSKR